MERDLNLIYTFIQVVKSGSFTAAAQILGTPTSTVSRHVTRLEKQLGTRLLQRTTRSLHLTDAGRLYYDCGEQIMGELEHAESLLAQKQAIPKGRVRVTAPLEYKALMQMVTRFLHQNTEVQLDLELTNRQVNLVEEGFDVAFRAGNLTDSSQVAYKLVDSYFQMCASPGYLEEYGEPKTLQALKEHNCVLFGNSSLQGTWTLTRGNDIQRIKLKGRIAVNHLGAVRDAVVEGLGIGLLPNFSSAPDITRGKLQRVLPEYTTPSTPIWIVYPSKRYLAPAVRAFIDYLKEHFLEELQNQQPYD